MDWEQAGRLVVQVGFPVAVSSALLAGLHFWSVKAFDQVVKPLSLEAIKTMQCTRRQLHRMARAAERIANSLEPSSPKQGS